VQGEAELPEVVLALGAHGGVAGLLDAGKEQGHKDADDGDDHQELDEGEGATVGRDRTGHGQSFLPGRAKEACFGLIAVTPAQMVEDWSHDLQMLAAEASGQFSAGRSSGFRLLTAPSRLPTILEWIAVALNGLGGLAGYSGGPATDSHRFP
jgi:hypothetical protein